MQTVAIFGVGLIGGSFGLALKKSGFQGTIVGVSSDATLRMALERGAIDEAAPLADAARGADLIYLAQPIGRILDTLHHLDSLVNSRAMITDAGSTKSAIVTAARKHIRRCSFLGGHPMAGKEKRGVGEADAELFRGRTYVLTPDDPDTLEIPPAKDFLAVAGPGLADTTRLALSPFELWRDILATNSQAIEQALTAYITKLEHLRDNLRTREIESEFEIAAALAATLR